MQTSLGTLHDAEARGEFFRDIAEVPPAATPPDGAASAAQALAVNSAADADLLRQATSARRKIARTDPRDMFARG